jgi:hypothetical protein
MAQFQTYTAATNINRKNKLLWREDDLINVHTYTPFFLTLLTGPRLCASRRPMRRLLRGAYEFCRWISMPDGRYRLEWREVINLWTAWRHYVSRRSLRFMWGSLICQLLSAPSVNSQQCGTTWFPIIQSSVYFCVTPTWNTDLLESVSENVDVNFAMKVPSKQFIIWWINLEQRDS